eukprot:14029392-Heterocapsa_arctica.AAC.1
MGTRRRKRSASRGTSRIGAATRATSAPSPSALPMRLTGPPPRNLGPDDGGGARRELDHGRGL